MPHVAASKRAWVGWAGLFALMIALGIAIVYQLSTTAEVPAPAPVSKFTGKFPELRPDHAFIVDFRWFFGDGPDFYVWRLEPEKPGKERAPNGAGVYVGLHPDIKTSTEKSSPIVGTFAGQEATWQRSDKSDQPLGYVAWETVVEYQHGPAFQPVLLHAWVWSTDDAGARQLIAEMGKLKFSIRE